MGASVVDTFKMADGHGLCRQEEYEQRFESKMKNGKIESGRPVYPALKAVGPTKNRGSGDHVFACRMKEFLKQSP